MFITYRPYSAFISPSLDYIRTNLTGITINRGTPVRMNSSGDVDFIDPAIEIQVLAIAGIANDDIANGQEGIIVTSGKVCDLTVAFAHGDSIWLSKTGGLTDIKPSEGVGGFVAGDFVIMLGVIAKNEDNPSLKDLILHIDIMGQL